MIENEHPIRTDWTDYYEDLEFIRESGFINVFEIVAYLRRLHIELSEREAQQILVSWIFNYNELSKRLEWGITI